MQAIGWAIGIPLVIVAVGIWFFLRYELSDVLKKWSEDRIEIAKCELRKVEVETGIVKEPYVPDPPKPADNKTNEDEDA